MRSSLSAATAPVAGPSTTTEPESVSSVVPSLKREVSQGLTHN